MLCNLSVQTIAATVVEINDKVKISLGDKLEYYIDAENKKTLSDILSVEDNAWQKSVVKTPNFGFTKDTYWFRLSLLRNNDLDLTPIIAIDKPEMDHIEVFEFNQGQQVQHLTTGENFPFKQRPIDHRNYLFPLILPKGLSTDIYIKVNTQSALQLPIDFYDHLQYLRQDQDEQSLKMLFYGTLIIMGLYNLFIFFSVRENAYLYYVLFTFSMVVLTSAAHGFLFQYLIPDQPLIQRYAISMGVPCVMLFACLFTSNFLRLRVVSPKLNKAVTGFAVAFIIATISTPFIPNYIIIRISLLITLLAVFTIMFAGPYAWYLGQKSARYFSLGWLFLLSGMLMVIANRFGYIPRNMFTEYAVNFGSVLEALTLSFALADRLNQERSERYKAQKERLVESLERKKAEEKLYHQATHQSVNGLPNIIVLQQTLYNLVNVEKVSSFTLLLIHLKNFHEVNKTLGQSNADVVLGLYSERLKSLPIKPEQSFEIEHTRDNTFYFSHIEGVVFSHILRTGNTKQAEMTAKGMKAILAEPINYNEMRLDLGVAFGIASYPVHGDDVGTLIRHARVAVDAADNSNQQIGIYSNEINPYSARRLALIGELSEAINSNTLDLYFQPIIDCESGQTIGAEALIRWNHANLGFVPPEEFISLAEKTGMIRALTDWVAQSAISSIKDWLLINQELLLSINISAINLQEKDFALRILSLLERYKVPATSLVLEVTETSVMANPESAISMLHSLANKGIKIAIDDFGTGHSSLSYIRKLPVYEVKIDRAFITALDTEHEDSLIARAALNLSHDLGYKVVAEGVETQSVQNNLKNMGCDYIQGYHIAKPMPSDDFSNWLTMNVNAENDPVDSDNIQTR